MKLSFIAVLIFLCSFSLMGTEVKLFSFGDTKKENYSIEKDSIITSIIVYPLIANKKYANSMFLLANVVIKNKKNSETHKVNYYLVGVNSLQLESATSKLKLSFYSEELATKSVDLVKEIRDKVIMEDIKGAAMEEVSLGWAENILNGGNSSMTNYETGSARHNPNKNRDKLDKLLGRGKYSQNSAGEVGYASSGQENAENIVIGLSMIADGAAVVLGITTAATGIALFGVGAGAYYVTKGIIGFMKMPDFEKNSKSNPLNNVALYVLFGLSVNKAFSKSIITKPLVMTSQPNYENGKLVNYNDWYKLDYFLGGFFYRMFTKDLEARKSKDKNPNPIKDETKANLNYIMMDISKCPDKFEKSSYTNAIMTAKFSQIQKN